MGYYSDIYMSGFPDYKRVGTYYGINNAIDVADRHRMVGDDVKITISETKYNAEFYSVWVRKKSLIEKLKEELF